jgi:hypothetical protein
VADADLGALADARAQVVKEYLLSSGKVGAERIFLSEKLEGGVKSDGSRAYLQLQ